MKNKLKTRFCDVDFKNPLVGGAGALGFGFNNQDWEQPDNWGGISLKGLTHEPRNGNPWPRIINFEYGMINSVGLRNPGWEKFLKMYRRSLSQIKTNIIVNISGATIEEYVNFASKVNDEDFYDFVELNISCPNVKKGGMAFNSNPEITYEIVAAVRKVLTSKKLIVKLSHHPQIQAIAQAAERGGADAISLINTIPAMHIDTLNQKPTLGAKQGGLSGIAIFHVALLNIYKVYEAVNIPIIGIGGAMNLDHVLQFIMAGATLVQLGTAIWKNHSIFSEINDGLQKYLQTNNLVSIQDLIGIAHQ